METKYSYLSQYVALASDLFLLASQLKEKSGASEKLYTQTLDYFKSFDQKAKALQLDEDSALHAKYALVAFIDECALNTYWPGRDAWMQNTLQWQFFNEHAAGEGFFKRLYEIRQQGEKNVDLLTLYYVCLELGFIGNYQVKGRELRQSLLVALRAQLDHYHDFDSLSLLDPASNDNESKSLP